MKWLGPAEFGWLIRVADASLLAGHREFVLAGYRVWTHAGMTSVGLVDPTDTRPGIVGTERHYDPDTPVTVIHQVRKPRRVRRS